MYPGVYFTTLRGIASSQSLGGITICKEAVDQGFLLQLKGLLLPCYLYLATLVDDHLEGEFIIRAATKTLACTRKELLKALIKLEEKEFIKVRELDPTSEKRPILFSLNTFDTPKREDFIEALLAKKFCRNEDLVEGLVALYRLPDNQEVHGRLREEIEEWFNVFDKEVIKEVFRRSYEWGQKNKEGRPFQYLTTILEDLKESGVVNYSHLEERDRLYYQIRELARSCGIKAHELNQSPIYRQVMERWITKKEEKDHALDLDVAQFAVEEATRKSRSRHPSLDYIEKNFIVPLKEAKIESIEEAKTFLRQEKAKTPGSQSKEKTPGKKSLHEQFAYWAK